MVEFEGFRSVRKNFSLVPAKTIFHVTRNYDCETYEYKFFSWIRVFFWQSMERNFHNFQHTINKYINEQIKCHCNCDVSVNEADKKITETRRRFASIDAIIKLCLLLREIRISRLIQVSWVNLLFHSFSSN